MKHKNANTKKSTLLILNFLIIYFIIDYYIIKNNSNIGNNSYYLYFIIMIIIAIPLILFRKKLIGEKGSEMFMKSLKYTNYPRTLTLILIPGAFIVIGYISWKTDLKITTYIGAILLILTLILTIYFIINPYKIMKFLGHKFIYRRKDLIVDNIIYEIQIDHKEMYGGSIGDFSKSFIPSMKEKITFTQEGIVIDKHKDHPVIEYPKWEYFRSYSTNMKKINPRFYSENTLILFLKKEYCIPLSQTGHYILIPINQENKDYILNIVSQRLPEENF